MHISFHLYFFIFDGKICPCIYPSPWNHELLLGSLQQVELCWAPHGTYLLFLPCGGDAQSSSIFKTFPVNVFGEKNLPMLLV